jgi:sterol desaturase/sphingolipid hydroxylase (fatty acid hydroxylase superfamily)
MHLWHHESRVTTPLTGFSMHPVESAAWCVLTLIPIVALSSMGALGPWGLAVFFYMQWVGNIAGHANAEIFPMPVTRASSFAQNALTYHCLHHARYDRHYGFAAATMDYLFGTEWPDWLAAFQRVSNGKPLTSLSERVEREG